MKLLDSVSLYYDDVNLIQQWNSSLNKSRKEIPKELDRIIVSPMSSVVGETFAKESLKLGLSVVLPRFQGVNWQFDVFNQICRENINTKNLWISIGLEEKIEDLFKFVILNNFAGFLIDVANGAMEGVSKKAYILQHFLKNSGAKSKIMIGNYHHPYSFGPILNLIQNPFVRVGIGGGGQCTTATKATGFGRGQITELLEFSEFRRNDFTIIADGGIKDGACASKAFGAGADYIMMGTYFSKAEEAQNVIDGEYKCWGSASDYNQEKFGDKRRHAEGKVTEIDKSQIRSLDFLVNELWGGISSAVSYGGYSKLSDFIGNGVFESKKLY